MAVRVSQQKARADPRFALPHRSPPLAQPTSRRLRYLQQWLQ